MHKCVKILTSKFFSKHKLLRVAKRHMLRICRNETVVARLQEPWSYFVRVDDGLVIRQNRKSLRCMVVVLEEEA